MTLLVAQVDGVPGPHPSDISLPYWEGTAIGELRFQRCDDCETANFGPGVACRGCQGQKLSWQVSAGLGTLYSWTVVWQAPVPGFEVPYAPAIVRLAEGYEMVSALVGVDHEEITSNMALAVVFHELDDGTTLPFFGPA